MLVGIGTDCIGSCKSNYHTITSTTALKNYNLLKHIHNLLTIIIVFVWQKFVFEKNKTKRLQPDLTEKPQECMINIHVYLTATVNT
jgi:hypothetical protein